MTQTTTAYLNGLLSKYTPAATDFDAARTHRAQVQNCLDNRLGVLEMFETGSLKHGTGVRFWSDADYVVSLKGSIPTPTTALTNVRAALISRFPNTHIHVSRPAVVCDFANGTETVEVVPAYPATGGGYWITDPRAGEWMKTHPKDHNTYVNRVNQKHDGGAKKLSRLVKTWKYERQVPLSSCYLEMRAAKYADGETSWSLPLDIEYFLRHLRGIDLAAMNDPTGLGSRFNAYSSMTNKATALSKLDTAITRAARAAEFYTKNEHAKAIEQYRLLFDQ